MDRWRGKVAVVTGASSGIGAALAQKLVEKGLVVVGLARRTDRLEELSKKHPGKLHFIKTDLTKEEEIVDAIKIVNKTHGPIHILVNNAGRTGDKGLLDGDVETWKQILDTNVIGLSIATREAVNSMMANKVDGHVVHINSVLGHKVLPGTNMYGASKYAVTNLTESLRLELNAAKSKIKITSISPGVVDSEFWDRVDWPKEVVDSFPKLRPQDVADAVLYVLGTAPHVQVHDLMIKPLGELC